MGLFDLFKGSDINAGVEQYKKTQGGILIDVRTGDEYSAGHIPGSINVPVETIDRAIDGQVSDMDAPLFLYCQSGARSSRATGKLQGMGYKNVSNIGGIGSYRGDVERGAGK